MLGDRIRALREARNLNQLELVKLAGVKQSTLSQLENNKHKGASIATLQAIARALDVTLEQLLGPPRRRRRAAS